MSSKEVSKQVRLMEWAEILRTRKASGQTVKAWCAANEINEKRYYYWQSRIRQATMEQISNQESQNTGIIPTGWTQLSVPTHVALSTPVSVSAAGTEASLTIEIGNSRIIAHENTSPELLSTTCRVLLSLC